jgi:DNA-binding MarR family transcriptional regulator
MSPTNDDTYREYPCPECAQYVPTERVVIITSEVFVDSRVPEDYHHVVMDGLAHRMVDRLLQDGFIHREIGDIDNNKLGRPVRATLGVVSRAAVARMEERIAARQMEVAREVVQETIRQIQNWGSYYGHSHLSGEQAIDSAESAFKAVEAKRSRVRMAV